MKKTEFEKVFNYLKLFTTFAIFTGIIYQYISIKGNISFFSYSEVINDSILAIPLVMVYLGAIFFSYHYIKNYKIIIDKHGFCKHVPMLVGILINSLIVLFLYKFLIFEKYAITTNNVTSLFILLTFMVALMNISGHLYINFFTINKIKILYIILGGSIYLISLSTINNIIYRDLCIIYDEKKIHIDYANDKYLFMDNGNILKVDKVDGFFNKKNCVQ